VYCKIINIFQQLRSFTASNQFSTFLPNFSFSFSTVWCNGYFQLSTVLPDSIFDTFIGHVKNDDSNIIHYLYNTMVLVDVPL
jgi:hypothetical protein